MSWLETEADVFFRQDAYQLGYLDDVHGPGFGRGLRAYYQDFDMIQPEVLEKEIPKVEITSLDLDLPLRDEVEE